MSDKQNTTILIANAILTEALRRHDIELESVYVPSKRSLSWSNSGKLDGELYRVKNIAQLSPENTKNLVRIEQPIIEIKIAAFTNKNIKISDWNSLKGYKIHYIRGRKLMAKKLPNFVSASDINTTNDLAQAMRILAAGRTDIVLADTTAANILIASDSKFKDIQKGQVIQTIKLYSYFNRKHAHLTPLISHTLQEMNADKTILQIQSHFLSPQTATVFGQ